MELSDNAMLYEMAARVAARKARDRQVEKTLARAEEAEARGDVRIAQHLRDDAEGWKRLDI